jgi:hypothetical protein
MVPKAPKPSSKTKQVELKAAKPAGPKGAKAPFKNPHKD